MNNIYIIIILSILFAGSSFYNYKHYNDADNLAALQNELNKTRSELSELKSLLKNRSKVDKQKDAQWKKITNSNLSTNTNDGATINELMK